MIAFYCLFGVGALLAALGLLYWMRKESQESTQELIEMFEIRERMSNAEYLGSVQASLRMMR